MHELKRSEFEAWLRAKDPLEVVGEPDDCYACPLARHLWELSAGQMHYVGAVTYGRKRMPEDMSAPKRKYHSPWSARFVREADRLSVIGITAHQCLAILAEIGEGPD